MSRIFVTLTALASFTCVFAQVEQPSKQKSLNDINLEELMKMEVTIASKKSESLMDVAAAIYVITQDDIRHSGATSVPDLLRVVPGVQVSQVTAHTWRISARGFNGQISNKLLVMIDGRSVYSPIYSGVYWNSQSVDLPDVDRIEVIRGPGGSLWGSNAVNGIINIITKHSVDTQGGLATASYGSQERTKDSLRYGGKLGTNGTYRIYGAYTGVEDFPSKTGGPNHDAYEIRQGGFRTDWDRGKDQFSFSGDAYNDRESVRYFYPTLSAPFSQANDFSFGLAGHNLLAKWTRTETDGTSHSLQAYWDVSTRADPIAPSRVETVNGAYQTEFLRGRHSIVYGADFKRNRERIAPTVNLSFSENVTFQDTYSAFFQDAIQSTKKLSFVVGSKFERNSYTGWEFQPSLRMLYAQSNQQVMWAAVTRAVRTPNMSERYVKSHLFNVFDPNTGLPVQCWAFGNSNFRSEDVIALEAGLRLRPTQRSSVDFTAYFNKYNHLRTVEAQTPTYVAAPVPYIQANYLFGNKLYGNTAGVEVSSKFKPSDRWCVTANYTYFSTQLRLDSDSKDQTGNYGSDLRGLNPRHQFSLTSFYNLSRTLDLDAVLYYTDREIASQEGPLTRCDIRLAWKPSSHWEISLVGQDLFAHDHAVTQSDLFSSSGIRRRSLYLSSQWKF